MTRKHTFEAASDNSRQLARTLYEAYGTNSNGKTFDGRDMPTWSSLSSDVKGHWIAVAETAVRDGAVAQATELAKQNEQRRRERELGETAGATSVDDERAAQNAARAREGAGQRTAHDLADEQAATNPNERRDRPASSTATATATPGEQPKTERGTRRQG